MPAPHYDFDIDQGATFKSTLSYLDGDEAPIDITGYSIRMQARNSARMDEIHLDLSTQSGGIDITNATEGEFTLHVTPGETAALNPSVHLVYDIELETPGGDVTRFIQGSIIVSPEVTR